MGTYVGSVSERHNITFYFYRFAVTSDMHASLIMRSLMIRQGACMHASTFEVCFIYHQGLSVIAQEALTALPYLEIGRSSWDELLSQDELPILRDAIASAG